MGDVRTDVLFVAHALADGAHLDILCPAGKRMVLTDVDCAAGTSSFAPQVWLEDILSGGIFIVLTFDGVLQKSQQWRGREVFNYGGGFRVSAHFDSSDVRGSGYFLDLP